MWDENSCFHLAQDVSHQSMGPEQDTVVLSLASGYLYTCNQTTADVLSAADGQRSFAEIVTLLAEQYDVDLPQLKEDLTEIINKLLNEKLLVLDA